MSLAMRHDTTKDFHNSDDPEQQRCLAHESLDTNHRRLVIDMVVKDPGSHCVVFESQCDESPATYTKSRRKLLDVAGILRSPTDDVKRNDGDEM